MILEFYNLNNLNILFKIFYQSSNLIDSLLAIFKSLRKKLKYITLYVKYYTKLVSNNTIKKSLNRN